MPATPGARPIKKRGSSRYLGVHWDTAVGRWSANVTDSGPPLRIIRLGHFNREEDAAVAWDRVVLRMRGLTAKRNFPDRLLPPASVPEIRREARRLTKLRMESRWIGVHRLRKSAPYQVARPWCAQVRLTSGKLVTVGGYATEEEAGLAYDRLTLFYRGDVVELNFREEAQRRGPGDARTLLAECERVRKANLTSQYRGVSWAAASGRWRAVIKCDRERIDLGLHDDEVDAARAYDAKARQLLGDRARLNFPSAVKRLAQR